MHATTKVGSRKERSSLGSGKDLVLVERQVGQRHRAERARDRGKRDEVREPEHVVGPGATTRTRRTTERRTRLGVRVERELEVSGRSMTEFAESSLVLAARRVMADRDRFVLSEEAAAAWDAVNDRPARELPGLRRLFERPSPFAE